MSRSSERIISQMWPDWELGESLGEGSFGEVQAIRRHSDYGPDLVSAVKVIRVPYMQSDVKSRRLQGMTDDEIREFYRAQVEGIADEIQIMQSLVGASNVVVIHDYKIVQQEDGVSWAIGIRMEKLEPLEEYFDRTSIPAAREVARLGIDVCNALQCCHEKNIVHRDVKPANVFYRESSDGYALGDFGIARQMQRDSSTTLSQRGTPFFMAPELYHGEHYGTNVDVYSLGIMLYRYLNHLRYPFCPPFPQHLGTTDEDKANRMRLQRNPLPPLTGINPNLSDIVCKACDPNPRTRYASAAEMREDLKTWLQHPDRQIVHDKRTVYVADLDKMTAEQERMAAGSGSMQSPAEPAASDPSMGTYVMGANMAGQQFGQQQTGQGPTVQPTSQYDLELVPPQPAPQRKWTSVLIGVCAALFVVAVILGVQIYNNVNNGTGGGSTGSTQSAEVKTGTTSSTTTTKDDEDEKVQQIVDDAEKKASAADYATAIAVIDEGLKEYPNSELLKAKKEAYEAKQEAQNTQKSQSEGSGGTSSGGGVTNPPETAPKTAVQLSPSTLPRSWSGNYVGTFFNGDGSEYQEERDFHMTLSSVNSDGSVSGVAEVDEESYYIVGSVDWESRYIEVEWAGWIVNKGTNSHRSYYGTISSDASSISGTTVGVHESDWYCTAD